MPASPRARRASNPSIQIDAQLAFVEFSLRQLVESDTNRSPDFRYGSGRTRRGLSLLSAERLTVAEKPLNGDRVTYEEDDPTYRPQGDGVPSISSKHAGWIANWEVFARGANPRLKDLSTVGQSYVELILPGGHLSGVFRCDTPDISRAQFLFGQSQPQYYAHETVVTLRYPLTTRDFVLRSESLNGNTTTDLTFTWGDADEIEILIGNGSLSSINNVMLGDFCGHDHQTLTDFEFECLYDVIDCARDVDGRLPVPRVLGREIRQIPCIVSTIGTAPADEGVLRNDRGSVTDFPGLAETPPMLSPNVRADIVEPTTITGVLLDIERHARASNHMCRILLDGSPLATGFLFEELDLVMTAAHVLFNPDGTLIDAARPRNLTVEFERIEIDNGTVTVDGVTSVSLHDDWAVNPTLANGRADREVDRLDYALLRLARAVGDEKVGKEARGVFTLPEAGEVLLSEGLPIRVFQHIDDDGLRSSIGVVKSFSPDRFRVGYSASTLDRASGGAVLDAEFNLVALHVAGSDENFPRQNQGLPIRRIARDIERRSSAPPVEVEARAS
jgi:hypothetical protein